MDKKRYTAILVDDEPKAIAELETLLKKHDDILVVGKFTEPDPAVKATLAQKPDLLFLDIQMPVKDGFQLLEEIKDQRIDSTLPVIVFITAFNQYALKAIKAACFDYLLKPIDPEELETTIKRLKQARPSDSGKSMVDQLLNMIKPDKKIRFSSRSGYILADPGEIIYALADWSYSEVFFSKDRKEVVTMNLGNVEELLAPYTFFRISRSILINLKYLEKVNRLTRTCSLSKGQEEFSFQITRKSLKALDELNQNHI